MSGNVCRHYANGAAPARTTVSDDTGRCAAPRVAPPAV